MGGYIALFILFGIVVLIGIVITIANILENKKNESDLYYSPEFGYGLVIKGENCKYNFGEEGIKYASNAIKIPVLSTEYSEFHDKLGFSNVYATYVHFIKKTKTKGKTDIKTLRFNGDITKNLHKGDLFKTKIIEFNLTPEEIDGEITGFVRIPSKYRMWTHTEGVHQSSLSQITVYKNLYEKSDISYCLWTFVDYLGMTRYVDGNSVPEMFKESNVPYGKKNLTYKGKQVIKGPDNILYEDFRAKWFLFSRLLPCLESEIIKDGSLFSYKYEPKIFKNDSLSDIHIVGIRFYGQTKGCYYYRCEKKNQYKLGDIILVPTKNSLIKQKGKVVFIRTYQNGEEIPLPYFEMKHLSSSIKPIKDDLSVSYFDSGSIKNVSDLFGTFSYDDDYNAEVDLPYPWEVDPHWDDDD